MVSQPCAVEADRDSNGEEEEPLVQNQVQVDASEWYFSILRQVPVSQVIRIGFLGVLQRQHGLSELFLWTLSLVDSQSENLSHDGDCLFKSLKNAIWIC